MSKNYVKAVLDDLARVTSPTETLVLLVLAEYTSDETRQAWPSVRSIVRRTRLGRRTVQTVLRRLESNGLIATATGGQIDGTNSASCYRLEFDHRGAQLDYKAAPKRSFQAVKSSTPAPRTATPTPSGNAVNAVSHEEAKAALERIRDRARRGRTPT